MPPSKPFLTLFAGLAWILPAQVQSPGGLPSSDPLYQTIARLDHELFDAYNTCELDKFKNLLDDQVEFYHDHDGLSQGSQTVTDAVKKNICGMVRRELVPGSLEVYPMKGYGAVEIGVHRFYQPKRGAQPAGAAKFIHLWRNQNGVWKITRVISYDHQPLDK